MSSISYDLDTSGGLMPLIRALIKPPDEEANGAKNKKPQHPYYKRPGKGHNHDSCDACGEGGDLICCDRCPASFHLGCYDPPLDENDIPAGLWLCKECHASDEKAGSSKGSRAQSPADSKDEKKPRSLRNKKNSKEDEKEEEKREREKEKEPEKQLTAMEVLVRAARVLNPRQFELPPDMRVPCPFPGTDKEDSKNGNATLITVDASGCVPLPAKSCYVCQGTCKMAPLLQCDYCPLLFHQDCLDPPLTALPTGRWMCPNHVEQYIDWKLVNSVSATERVALWDRFAGPVDQHAIKIDFIRRARRAAPPFRVKVPAGLRGRVAVPEMVRHHYRRPPPLLPSRREHVRCTAVLESLQRAGVYTEEEDSSAPKHTVCLNAACPQYRGGQCDRAATKLEGATEEDAKDDLEAIAETNPTEEDSSDLSDVDFEHVASKRRRPPRGSDAPPAKRVAKLQLSTDGDTAELLAAVDEQLEKLDERLIRLLAWQRLQQVVAGEAAALGGAGPLSGAAARAVRRSVDRARLARFGFRHVALPSELLDHSARDRIARAVWGGAGAGGAGGGRAASPAPASPGHSLSDAAVRATLCVVLTPARNGLGDGLGRPVPMRLSRLTVGSCGNCDVVLDARRCRRVSPRHAVIFHDEVTRHFELINYSEWGSRVNGVLYTCDVARAPPPPPRDEGDARAAAVRDLVRPRMPRPLRLNGALRGGAGSPHPCRCPEGAGAAAAAWEGSALVPHAALLQFGCLMYVFSIADTAAFPSDGEVPEPTV